jgi:hypothetical protein
LIFLIDEYEYQSEKIIGMDLSLLEYACGMGAWISLMILVVAYFVAEEHEFYTTSLTKALLAFLIPLVIMTALYILFHLGLVLYNVLLWILMLMIRPDIVGATFFVVLLNLVYITVNHTTALLNVPPNLNLGIKDEL